MTLELLDIESDEEVVFPPGDLYSDEPPMETYQHLMQMALLIQCLNWWWRDRDDFFVAGNITIYYSPRQQKSESFRGPDFFVVLDAAPNPRRKSWVVWEEDGKYPNMIIEILSKSTADIDRGLKKQIYQSIFRTPDYFMFDPVTHAVTGFHLVDGVYEPLPVTPEGRLWSQQLELYLGVVGERLRFFTPEGELVHTPEESAQLAEHRADLERQQKDKMAAKLRELNIDPDSL